MKNGEFEIGDEVMLNPESYYAGGCGQLPLGIVGKVYDICGVWIRVEWDEDGDICHKGYPKGNLVLVEPTSDTKEDLSKYTTPFNKGVDKEELHAIRDADDTEMDEHLGKVSALDTQVDGTHYKGMKIQPVELVYKLGGTPSFCKVAKYTTRVKDDKLQQMDKAIHCTRLEQELREYAENFYTYDKSKLHLIYEFTDNIHIAAALVALTYFDYSTAIYQLELLREENK